ncbi:hypothetical protein WJX77_010969 [Trebouxia sp. C0004]
MQCLSGKTCQVPIKLLHPTFGKFEHFAESVQPTVASLNFVQAVHSLAHYNPSEEKDYKHVLWEETWPLVLDQSFAATFVIEMMGAGLRSARLSCNE